VNDRAEANVKFLGELPSEAQPLVFVSGQKSEVIRYSTSEIEFKTPKGNGKASNQVYVVWSYRMKYGSYLDHTLVVCKFEGDRRDLAQGTYDYFGAVQFNVSIQALPSSIQVTDLALSTFAQGNYFQRA
jgi:hypothetical protein